MNYSAEINVVINVLHFTAQMWRQWQENIFESALKASYNIEISVYKNIMCIYKI